MPTHSLSYRTSRTDMTKPAVALCICFCLFLAACSPITIPATGSSTTPTSMTNGGQCPSTCPMGTGAHGTHIFVQPAAGEQVITNAIGAAKKSVWLEIYLLTDTKVISALEEAANRKIDVRIILETHPYGGGGSAKVTMDKLSAAGARVQAASPDFSLTHEKGMIIDGSMAFIMTANFTRSALGGSSATTNREYGIIDTNPQDVQAVINIFNADWNHKTAYFTAPNLVVSPINSRNVFSTLISNASSTLLIEAEEMNDQAIEQMLVTTVCWVCLVGVFLPLSYVTDMRNAPDIDPLKKGGVVIRADSQLYMHAKIIIADSKIAFVGSVNISTASFDNNRELGILVADIDVLGTLQQTFQLDWEVSKSV